MSRRRSSLAAADLGQAGQPFQPFVAPKLRSPSPGAAVAEPAAVGICARAPAGTQPAPGATSRPPRPTSKRSSNEEFEREHKKPTRDFAEAPSAHTAIRSQVAALLGQADSLLPKAPDLLEGDATVAPSLRDTLAASWCDNLADHCYADSNSVSVQARANLLRAPRKLRRKSSTCGARACPCGAAGCSCRRLALIACSFRGCRTG